MLTAAQCQMFMQIQKGGFCPAPPNARCRHPGDPLALPLKVQPSIALEVLAPPHCLDRGVYGGMGRERTFYYPLRFLNVTKSRPRVTRSKEQSCHSGGVRELIPLLFLK